MAFRLIGSSSGAAEDAAPRPELVEGPVVVVAYKGPRVQADAPACASCGWIMTRSGTCYRCENCGSTSGCS